MADPRPKCRHARCDEHTDQVGALCPWCRDELGCVYCWTLQMTASQCAERTRMLDAGEIDIATYTQMLVLEALMRRALPSELFRVLARLDKDVRLELAQWIYDSQKARELDRKPVADPSVIDPLFARVPNNPSCANCGRKESEHAWRCVECNAELPTEGDGCPILHRHPDKLQLGRQSFVWARLHCRDIS